MKLPAQRTILCWFRAKPALLNAVTLSGTTGYGAKHWVAEFACLSLSRALPLIGGMCGA
jgi:PII-like signaling protein